MLDFSSFTYMLGLEPAVIDRNVIKGSAAGIYPDSGVQGGSRWTKGSKYH